MAVPKQIWVAIIKILLRQIQISDRFIDIIVILNKSMATAYVLINCELGSEEAIIEQLKSLDGVK